MLSRNIITSLIFIFLFITWVYYNTFTKTQSSSSDNVPSISSYPNLSHWVIPDKYTSLILPKSPCNGEVFLVVVVCSAVSNFKSRDAIRETWGRYRSSKHSIKIFFLLGTSSNDHANSVVAKENDKYSDIIQENFLDTYNNLTLKSVMLLKWVNQNCGNAKFVMKTDDDMFVHLPNLVHVLETKRQSNVLLGCFLNDSSPNRDRSSKYYVPENWFQDQKYYPPYLSGTGYVFSGDTVPSLFKASLESEFFHLEDVFITGVCASKIGLRPCHDGRFLYKNDERNKDCCTLKSLITAHKIPPEELLHIWHTCFQNVMSQSSCLSSANSIAYAASTSLRKVFFTILVSFCVITVAGSFSF